MTEKPQTDSQDAGVPLPGNELREGRPDRPSLRSPNLPPVLARKAPPFSVRLTQLLWALSFIAGAVAIVYFFVVRQDLLPLVSDAIRAVDGTRSDETYDRAADIFFWSAFAVMVTLLLVQITLLVSFTNRRPGVRWWQFATLVMQAPLYALALEIVGGGEYGAMLRQMLTAQCGLVLLALLVSSLPNAVNWSVQQHDVRRGTVSGPGAASDL